MGCVKCEHVEECKESWYLIQTEFDELSLEKLNNLKRRFKVVNDAYITSLFTLALELEGVYDLSKENEIYERNITDIYYFCPVAAVIYAENCLWCHDQIKRERRLEILTAAANKGYWKAYGVLGQYAYKGNYGDYEINNQLAIKYLLKAYELCNEGDFDKAILAISLSDLYKKEGENRESDKWMNTASLLQPRIQYGKYVITANGQSHPFCQYIFYSYGDTSPMQDSIFENIPIEIKIADNHIKMNGISVVVAIVVVLSTIVLCCLFPLFSLI